MRSPSSPPRWVTALDVLAEVLLAGFAVFTVVHLLGAEAGWSARATGVVWLVLGAPTMAGFAWWGLRSSVEPRAGESPSSGSSLGLVTGTAFALLSALVGVMCAVSGASGFTAFWALGLLMALWSVVLWSRGPRVRTAPAEPSVTDAPRPTPAEEPAAWAHLFVLVVAVGLGVFVLFVLNPSRDDVYYLNRATWVAQHGTFPSGDTMFGPQTFPATYGAGLPIAALEEAYGSLARLFGAPAATLAYLVLNPVLAALSVWGTWRLVRAWAPRRAVLALVVAIATVLFSATGLLGDFGYAREWQGKVVVILLVMPLVWVHLTRLARGVAPAWSVVVLGALGVAWCGLTITAPIFAGVLAGVGLLAALFLPDRRIPLGLGALALLGGPLLTGLATVLSSNTPIAEENYVSEPSAVWSRVLGTDLPVVALLGFALLVGPLLVRTREGRLLAVLAGVVTLGSLVPGLFELLDAATGSGPVAVRLLLTAPWPVLTGLLVTATVPAGLTRRAPAFLPGLVAAVVVLGLLVGTGTSVWSHPARAELASSPTWKLKPGAHADVEALLATDPGPGPVLLPAAQGRILAVLSTRTFSVVPRDFYIQFLREPREQHRARYAFRRFVDPSIKDPVPDVLGRAMETLDVTLACVPAGASAQRDELRRIGLTGERRVRRMVCFDGPGTGTLPVTPPAGRAPAR